MNAFLIMGGFFVVGVAWWAFGQWLRRRGHGQTLDNLGATVGKAQGKVTRLVGSALSKNNRTKK